MSPTDPIHPTGPTALDGRRLDIRYAALSDTGLVRESNQDAVHAGPRLLAVADGLSAAVPDDEVRRVVTAVADVREVR